MFWCPVGVSRHSMKSKTVSGSNKHDTLTQETGFHVQCDQNTTLTSYVRCRGEVTSQKMLLRKLYFESLSGRCILIVAHSRLPHASLTRGLSNCHGRHRCAKATKHVHRVGTTHIEQKETAIISSVFTVLISFPVVLVISPVDPDNLGCNKNY